ncbi:ABC transporter ATP-binding protein [Thiospirochaeta perfilievii]|uniref:ABC transporter ATP-binding protein n=1 Tax=Thiospirochaeta perfilievii TaxID=252967 RepID=A0A5C1Q9T3_9SPIO|nr:ABC transporter ATP-binding protein [Thiospirochaeta perfilievii]QEN03669.1 ABC transporter ATP-binding protein [Thiospirochaeta perfilievii]
MISLQNVDLWYGSEHALDNINFSIDRGETLAIVGASGCGKTSILYLLADLLKPTSGNISNTYNKPMKKGLLFQTDMLLPWKNILNNTLLGLKNNKRKKEEAMDLLKMYNIQDQAYKYPSQLSGGQRQRAALARTILNSPDLLLLDEPTSALDEISKELLQNQLKETADLFGLTLILVTHNIEEAVYLGKSILIMEQKKIIKKIDNPSYSINNSRSDPSFFEVCCQVRQSLKEANVYE